MNDVIDNPAVTRYVGRLDRALAVLPRARRDEIVGEILEHIEQAHAELPEGHGEADVQNLLDRLGEPEQIAREARARFGVEVSKAGWVEYVGLALITVGSLAVPVLGWLAGIVLVWLSKVWRTREKLLATFVFPFGLFPATMLSMFAPLGVRSCSVSGGEEVCSTSGEWIVSAVAFWAVVLLSTVGVIAVAVYLGRRARKAGDAALA